MIKVLVDILGVSESASFREEPSAAVAVPPPGLFSLLRLPGFFKQVVGVDLHQAKFHR